MGTRATASVSTGAEPDGDRLAQILDAATRIFQERGYDATTIQVIADEVGILKGSLYHYIDTKEDLLYWIIADVHRGLEEATQSTEHVADPAEGIRLFVQAHLRFCAANLAAIGVFLQDFRALSGERRNEIVLKRDAYEKRFRQLLLEGQQRGVVRRDVDVELMSFGAMGMMNWMYQWYRPGGRRSPDEIGRAFAALVLDSVARRPKG